MIIALLLAFLGAGISARLFTIQVLQSGQYAQESRKQAQQRVLLPAKRGDIRDRNGRVLSTSVGSQLTVRMTELAPRDANGRPSAGPDSQGGTVSVKRVYPFGEAAGAVLGYVGKDGEGLSGAEFYFDKYLRGESGWAILKRDGRNRRYPTPDLPRKEPYAGCDVYLTIDIDVQKTVESVLGQAVEKLGAKGGMAIVMEPATGNILAMAGEPAFNPNMAMRYGLDERANKCIGYTFEPGSTFKVVAAACALQEHIKKETDTIDGNNGVYVVFDQKIRDVKPYGLLTFREALCYSSNVCFAKVANDIGNERLYRYARDFGFGARAGVQLPGEEAGILHPIDKWSGRTRVTMAIGQEISVTLLQMAMLFSAVANNGVLVQPRIVQSVRAPDGTIIDSSHYRPVRRVIAETTARRLAAMLTDVVSKGTGVKAAIQGVAIAGKTGTAQKIDKETGAYSSSRCWASFIGFVTPDDPQLLCAVVIDEPAHGETGGMAAAPAFRKIIGQIISHPQLEFAEKFLFQQRQDTNAVKQDAAMVPDVCGLASDKASSFLQSESIPFECVGGRGTIAFQQPSAGGTLSQGKKLMLYTVMPDSLQRLRNTIAVPPCCGKDLRDAVNAMNLKGLVPYVIGAGTVKRQAPAAGTLVRSAEACTLLCAFGDTIRKL
jgi:cell division protein FtsI (penicillin-binding protein 3)